MYTNSKAEVQSSKTRISWISHEYPRRLCCRLEPNMLKNLPIIPSWTSQNFYPLFFFIPIAPPIIPFLFYCASDNITMQG